MPCERFAASQSTPLLSRALWRNSLAGSAVFVCGQPKAPNVTSEEIKKDGLASVIKYEDDNETLAWKHPVEDFNFGSQLIVHESQEAIFFRDGQALDLFGAGRYTLETQQLPPLLKKLYRLPADTEGTFHSEVYFINKTVRMSLKWGTPDKIRFIDPPDLRSFGDRCFRCAEFAGAQRTAADRQARWYATGYCVG